MQKIIVHVKDGYEVYLYAPYVTNTFTGINVIDRTELIGFYEKNRDILPESITQWENIFE